MMLTVQAPNSKHQISNKLQTANVKRFWSLGIGLWKLFGD
jgi:hypothetical protein